MSRPNPIVTPSQILDAMSGEKMSFSEYYPDTNQIIVRKITLNEDLEIKDITCQASFSFVDCSLHGVINIRGGTFDGFTIAGGQMTKRLNVYGGTFNKSFELQEIDALSMGAEYGGEVGFWGGEFNCDVSIFKGAFKSIIIGNAILKSLTISSGPTSSYNHELEPYIKQLGIAPRQIEVLQVDAFKVERLELIGVLEHGLYSFGDVTLNQLVIRTFLNRGRVMFDNLNVFTVRVLKSKKGRDAQNRVTISLAPSEYRQPTLSMVHAHLGQTRFSQTDFTKFEKIEISDCTFTDIESSNTKWFSAAQLKDLRDEARRDVFRQLKHGMIRQGNRIDELYFQALEMDAYRRTLSLKENPWDLLILLIGKYTNNFGTNYVLPIIWILVVSFLVFQCSLWAQGLSFGESWGNIFVVMNPTHSIDYLAPREKLSNLFMAVDFAGRILISMLIYQLITPFRKFARG